MVELRTDRLLLREFREEDWPALHAVESLPEVALYQAFDARTPEESHAYVLGAIEGAGESPRDTYDMAIVLPETDRVVGRCGFAITDPDQREAVLWYTLHPDAWGKGITTEAARAVVDFAFRELNLHRIWAECDPRNPGSWRVLEKIGMRREAHFRENARTDDGWADSFIYAVLAREWEWR